MRILYIVAAFVLCGIVVNGQAPEWEWAKSPAGYSGGDIGTSISTDANGIVYVTGTFGYGTLIFGNDSVTNDLFTSLFIVKYDTYGNVIWARCPAGQYLTSYITTDNHSNVYVTGCFGGPPAIFGNDTLIATGVHNFFIAKYDSSGNVIWAKTASNAEDVYSAGVATDIEGNVAVTGIFDSSIVVFASDTLINSAGNPGMANIFIVKYSPTGDVLWDRSTGGGILYGGVNSIISNTEGDILLTGYIYGDTIWFGKDTLSSDTVEKMFVVKYDSAGNVIWTTNTAGNSFGTGIASDSHNNVFVTGGFASSSIAFGNNTLINNGNINFFTAKYSSNGSVVWVKSVGGTAQDLSSGIATDTGGNVYVVGSYESPVVNFGNRTFISDSDVNTFVVKYDSAGNIIWAESPAASYVGYGNVANSISTDAIGNVYVTGYFNSPTVIFGNDTLTVSEFVGFKEFFIGKLTNSPSTGIPTIATTNIPITVYPNPTTGKVYFSGIQTGYTLQVYNVLGEMISSSTVDRDNYAVNLSGKAKGMYFYRVEDGAVLVQQGKIVLE